MKLVILEDYDKASEWAAKYVRNSILKFNPGPGKLFVLGLPTGITYNVLSVLRKGSGKATIPIILNIAA